MSARLRVLFLGGELEPEVALLRAMVDDVDLRFASFEDGRPRWTGTVDVIVAIGVPSAEELETLLAGAAVVRLGDGSGGADVAIPRQPMTREILALAIVAALDRRALRDKTARSVSGEPDFELIFEGSPLGIALVATDGRMIDVNPALARLLGFTRAELCRLPFSSLLDPLANDTTRRTLVSRLASADCSIRKERRLRRKDGSFITTEVSTALVRDRSGRVVALLQTVADLSERAEAANALVKEVADRRKAEADAREAHEFLAAALQHIPAGVLIVERPGGDVILMNERLREVCGGSDSALGRRTGSSAARIVREDGTIYPREELPLVKTLADGASHGANDAWIQPDGGPRVPVVCRSAPIPYRGREAAILVVQDVTQIREQERQRRSAEARYRSLFDQGSGGIFIVTSEQKIVEANPAGERLFGYAAGELVGRSILALAPEEQPDGRSSAAVLGEMIDAGRRSGHAVFSWRGQYKTGGLLELEVTVQAVHLENSPDLLLIQARDVTRQRSLEEKLRQSQKLEAIGLLAGGVAHDYNNLLTGVIGFIELAIDRLGSESGKRSEQARKFLGDARRAANRSVELTRQLLTFSRREKGHVALMDLNESVERQASMIRRLLGETAVLELDLAPDGCPIRGDTVELEQALLNLAINARDAMPKGGTLRIATSRYKADAVSGRAIDLPAGEYVVLTVSDEGTGMSDSVRARIFQPFFTTKERGRGTGLGLAVVHGVVQHHGGLIFVDSTLGEGSRFTIILPCAGDERVPRAMSCATAPLRRGTGRILVVDDDPTVREVTGAILDTLGYEVSMVESAAEALERIAAGLVLDLVVTDVVMPGMSGVELEQRLRVERPGLKVLLVSGYAKDVFERHGIVESAAPALLKKPLTIESLGKKVRELLGREGPAS